MAEARAQLLAHDNNGNKRAERVYVGKCNTRQREDDDGTLRHDEWRLHNGYEPNLSRRGPLDVLCTDRELPGLPADRAVLFLIAA